MLVFHASSNAVFGSIVPGNEILARQQSPADAFSADRFYRH
jgi:hypothetical protein